jgi:hypothetical protein
MRAYSRARIASEWLGTVTIPADSGTSGDERRKKSHIGEFLRNGSPFFDDYLGVRY